MRKGLSLSKPDLVFLLPENFDLNHKMIFDSMRIDFKCEQLKVAIQRGRCLLQTLSQNADVRF
jgi:hypothetical protein